jgi:hypothetical protein
MIMRRSIDQRGEEQTAYVLEQRTKARDLRGCRETGAYGLLYGRDLVMIHDLTVCPWQSPR